MFRMDGDLMTKVQPDPFGEHQKFDDQGVVQNLEYKVLEDPNNHQIEKLYK